MTSIACLSSGIVSRTSVGADRLGQKEKETLLTAIIVELGRRVALITPADLVLPSSSDAHRQDGCVGWPNVASKFAANQMQRISQQSAVSS